MGPRAKRGAKAEAAEEKPQDKKAKSGLAVGDDLPPFELETDEDNTVASADLVRPRTADAHWFDTLTKQMWQVCAGICPLPETCVTRATWQLTAADGAR